MDLVFVYEKRLGERFVPNGLPITGPFYQRFLKGEGEYGNEGFCRSPLLNLFQEFEQDFAEVLLDAGPQQTKIYLVEMLYSLAVWLPRPNGDESPLSPWPQIGAEVLDLLRRREAVMIVTHLKRAERDPYVYDLFYCLHAKLDQLGIPADQVIFIGCAPDAPAHYTRTVRERGIQTRLRAVHYIPYFEWGWRTYFERYRKDGQIHSLADAESDLNRLKPYRYLCFNREPRAHRLVNALWLQSNGLLEQGLLSFPQEDSYFNFKKFNPYQEGVADIFTDPEILALNRGLAAFRQRLPLLVDHPDLFRLHISWCRREPFRDTYFSLLTERLFHNPRGHLLLTSKAYKSISNMHPFILLGPCRALAQLHADGYQTFTPWIDESYDLEADPNRRAKRVWAEVKRLCALSAKDMIHWYRELLPILKFNWEHFHQRGDPRSSDGLNPVQDFARSLAAEIHSPGAEPSPA